MANKAKGWLRQRERVDGMTWLWCYQRLSVRDGRMVENCIPLGLVAEIGDADAAWIRVGELRLIEKYMSLVFDFVDHNELYSIRNPMDKVTIPASEEEHPEVKQSNYSRLRRSSA